MIDEEREEVGLGPDEQGVDLSEVAVEMDGTGLLEERDDVRKSIGHERRSYAGPWRRRRRRRRDKKGKFYCTIYRKNIIITVY